ncbi:hypothetical protein POM88_044843 [Heracleum sosnowskyi]|uniref:Uncharacterized protein n=1 Tax=Heracleum sosnowskyi TaxID=360622 RepID=A0AAD8H4P0_9APIA|nr:hypothetical protein POM88_044843 [Heracleum sosnowskyi]
MGLQFVAYSLFPYLLLFLMDSGVKMEIHDGGEFAENTIRELLFCKLSKINGRTHHQTGQLRCSRVQQFSCYIDKEMSKRPKTVNSRGELLIDSIYDPLIPREEKTPMEIFLFNLIWKRIAALLVVWVSFLLLQIIKARLKGL